MRTRRHLLLALCAAAAGATLLSACSDATVGTPTADPEFMAWYTQTGMEIEADPNYKRMPIDTPEQVETFSARLYQAYRGEITVAEFAELTNATYPGHAYEVAFFTARLQRR